MRGLLNSRIWKKRYHHSPPLIHFFILNDIIFDAWSVRLRRSMCNHCEATINTMTSVRRGRCGQRSEGAYANGLLVHNHDQQQTTNDVPMCHSHFIMHTRAFRPPIHCKALGRPHFFTLTDIIFDGRAVRAQRCTRNVGEAEIAFYCRARNNYS